MNIILIFNKILNDFNKIFQCNLNPFTLESKIRECENLFATKSYEHLLNSAPLNIKKQALTAYFV